MKTHAISVVAALLCGVTVQAETPAAGPAAQSSLHGPVIHKNLQVFLITGEDRMKDVKVKTLDEAMKEKSVVVRETGDVNKLSIENNADAGYVYVQSGDIVKGGKQDRTLPNDFLVKAGSGKLPVEAFCVEQGRWQKRGAESVAAFSGSTKILSSNALKYAAKVEKSQGAVWEKVAGDKLKLSANVYKAGPGTLSLQQGTAANGGASVNDARSATSLQLALENKDLEKMAKEYTDALRKAPETVPGAVGFAYAVNGVMTGAEIYANGTMFLKLWPRLLESVVTEAIAEQADGKDGAPLGMEAAGAWLDETAGAASQREEYPAGNATLKREAKKSVRFDTLVPAAKGKAKDADWIHRSILRKEGVEPAPANPAAPPPAAPAAPAPAPVREPR